MGSERFSSGQAWNRESGLSDDERIAGVMDRVISWEGCCRHTAGLCSYGKSTADTDEEAEIVPSARIPGFVDTDIRVEKADQEGDR